MTQPLDPSAQSSDASAARANNVFELPAKSCASDFARPGFYLMKDAGGRFVVDRDMGVVSLADAALLERERGATHQVRLKVVEASGESYELDMTLRVTGLVPQMVGPDEFAFGGGEGIEAPAPRRSIAWESYSVTANAAPAPLGDEDAPFGALLSPPRPALSLSRAQLQLGAVLPRPAPKRADWTI